MNYQINSSHKSFQSAITNEQLHQIIEAITNGRYSWACVLILRFVGHNPLHFIPQRTYSRLMKENRQTTNVKLQENINESIQNPLTDKLTSNNFKIQNKTDDADC